MRRPLVLMLTLGGVLAIGACTPASTTPTGNPATGGPAAKSPAASKPPSSIAAGTPIQVRDFALDPPTLSVTAGTVTLAVTNDGPTIHNVKVRDGAGAVLFGSIDLREGQSDSVSGDLAPGEYVLFCSLAGHESLGIKGTLTVTAP